MQINGSNKLVNGAVLTFVGDTLASHEFCGFKVGVGFAYQKCRECICTNADIQNIVHQRFFFLPRSLFNYDLQCTEIGIVCQEYMT